MDVDHFEDDDIDENEMRWSEPHHHIEYGGSGAMDLKNDTIRNATVGNCTAAVPSTGKTDTMISGMTLNDNKAGMDGLNKEKINKIIMDASKGSRFYENERKKQSQVNQRIERMLQQLAGITEQQETAARLQVTAAEPGLMTRRLTMKITMHTLRTRPELDATVARLEASRRFDRSIVHLDMDAFYAAVETRDNPCLRDVPMAVGGMSMLSTSNYHARRFGVRAAMPGFIAKKLCPELIIVPVNFDKYRAVSHTVRAILAEYDPDYCPMSLDEAYFDLTEHLERRQDFSESRRTFRYASRTPEGSPRDVKVAAPSRSEGERETWNRGAGEVDDAGENPKPMEFSECPSSGKPERDGTASICQRSSSSDENNQAEIRSYSSEPSNLRQMQFPSSSTSLEAMNDHRVMPEGRAVTPKTKTFGFTVEDTVGEIRFRIEQETQLTASAGIAPNTMLAKICSDKNKPNGQYRILPNREAVMEFVHQLPIRKVSGIGKVTEKLLTALGIQNCSDLYQKRAVLYFLFSPLSSEHFLRISLGLGSTRVERDSDRKSMSTERTFGELHQPADLYSKCNELCQALAEDLKKEQLTGKTVTIKLKTVKFEVKTRASSVPAHISSADCIFRVAKDLLRTEMAACKPEPLRLRLMGVRLSNLQPCGAATPRKQNSITNFFKKQRSSSPVSQTGINSTSPNKLSTSGGLGPNNAFPWTVGDPTHNGCEIPSASADTDWRRLGHGDLVTNATKIDGLASTSMAASSDADWRMSNLVAKETETDDIAQTSTLASSYRGRVRMSGLVTKVAKTDDLPSTSAIGSCRPKAMFFQTLEESINEPCLPSSSGGNMEEDRLNTKDAGATTAKGSPGRHEEKASSGLVCPVCNVGQTTNDLDALNEHVDICLNKGAIQDILQEGASQQASGCSRHLAASPPSKGKRSLSGTKPASKRRKQDQKPKNTIDRFFT